MKYGGDVGRRQREFRRFVEAEVAEMLWSMDVGCRAGSRSAQLKAIEWIEKNAVDFRRHWASRGGEIRSWPVRNN